MGRKKKDTCSGCLCKNCSVCHNCELCEDMKRYKKECKTIQSGILKHTEKDSKLESILNQVEQLYMSKSEVELRLNRKFKGFCKKANLSQSKMLHLLDERLISGNKNK